MRSAMSAFFMLGVLLTCGGLAQAGYLDIYQDYTINNNLGSASIVFVHNAAQVTVLDTSYASFDLLNSSVVTVYGGNATYTAENSSILKLHGGSFTSPASAYVTYTGTLAKIYVYGQNFQILPWSDNNTTIRLLGNWLDGTSFNIYFRGLPQPFEQALGTNIFLVPEPVTTAFLLVGILGLKRFRR